ncbi:hypothetical protein Anas_06168 [Armadillidium nasatum]|uniref:FHF complex subunit HOOK-interacting protein C-terminal domain-containing protein n=1 Tax=Armadillidium nasatum TaxID=96803 RepID=A0A5N5SX73_9CRUS|nr:hypothetical protein Anas_06168 [Armadillidium nasatum]
MNMNNWIGGWTPFTINQGKSIATNLPSYQLDHVAAYNAFVRHWQQIKEIFEHSQITCDDVTAVVNHYGQMINFLLVDLKSITIENSHANTLELQKPNNNSSEISDEPSNTPIFDHFLGERVLQTIFQWSSKSGEFFNVLKLEQLKAFETLLSNSHPEILVYTPITEPLLLLLESCSGCVPVEVEKRLVVLLNQLWVSLKDNQHLLKYFLVLKGNTQTFLIFSLLLPFIHRDGGIGQQSRDALLLSMSVSASDSLVANYIYRYSNFCPVIAAGLSGLYSMLPRSLSIKTEGWYRISSDDVASIPALFMFANSLGFCNAIVQIAHPSIQRQLIDYLYQGFLVTVVGPALIQNVLEEVVAAIAYVEFFLQSVTEEKLQRAFLALLLSPQEWSDLPLVTTLISHLHSSYVQLSLVTLNLFNTLINLYSEDAMITLVFQYLTPCSHVMLSQRSKLSQSPFYAADRFLRLLPSVCQVESALDNEMPELAEKDPELITPFSVYLKEARMKIIAASHACSSWTWAYDAQSPPPSEAVHLISAAKLIPVIPYSKARMNSESCTQSLPYDACKDPEFDEKQKSWSLPVYGTEKLETSPSILRKNTFPHNESNNNLKNQCNNPPSEQETMDSFGESSGYYSPKGSGDSSPLHTNRNRNHTSKILSHDLPDTCQLNENNDWFLQFLDESDAPQVSGEEDELEFIDDFYNAVEFETKKVEYYKIEEEDSDFQSLFLPSLSSGEEVSNDENGQLMGSHPKPSIGPFLEALINHIDNFFTSNIDTSMLAMLCVSNLATYPCPLLTSLLLQPSVVLQPAVRSLYQVLGQVKQKIDSILTSQDLPIFIDARRKFQQSFSFEAASDKSPLPSSSPSPFTRGTPLETTPVREDTLVNLPGGSGYRYINSSNNPVSPFLLAPTEKRQAAICAVLFQEWLLELAALAEEHTVNCHTIRFHSISRSS